MRLAFIGGRGHHYLRGALSDAQIAIERPVAVAGDGADNPAAEAFAATLGDAQYAEDAVAMLDRVQPEIVSIGCVYGVNSAFICAALERGIAVVSDKPIATSWDALRQIEALCETSAGRLITELPFRAQPEFRAARAAAQDGRIGEVALASAQKSYRFGVRPPWYADRALYGGTILWIASHGIDVIRFTTGQAMRSLCGHQGNISKPDFGAMEDHTVSVFELANGGTGLVHADFLRPDRAKTHGDDRLRIAGSRGVLEVRDGRCLLTTHDSPETDITDEFPHVPIYSELLKAAWGDANDLYSTEHSLEIAATFLQARDCADGN